MQANSIPTRYNPKGTEDKWYSFWEAKGLFKAKVNKDKKPFCIVIPPPNVTGILHMGHALNNTYQDILIRLKRMQGSESLWMPGTDHAGIATQNVVERDIAKDGLKRDDLGREKFLERVWKWKEDRGSTIIKQLKKLGASCDWGRARFTMDKEYSEAVKDVFIRLWNKELIYRGRYMINWCPRCRTALSDEESQHKELDGNLYYIKYPFKDDPKKFVTVATTRPETMLGDTAVAVNPKDKRFKDSIGKTLILPLIEREIKIIKDDLVDAKFGTGAVKVTPAHDPNDYQMGMRHNLEFVNIMHPDGVLNNNAGEFEGMDRFEAREAVLEVLQEKKLLLKPKPHKHAVGHCYRCHTVVEPYLSEQWFVDMDRLAKPAIDVVKKEKIKFYPKRWTKVYFNWMENIQDWCISRQIWWGHRIPVWYCNNCYERPDARPSLIQPLRREERGNPHEERWTTVIDKGRTGERLGHRAKGLIISKDEPKSCPNCGSSDLKQDEDVLDTWFSSWLWPFATFYWPKKSEDLDYFYPTSVLVTAPEIIFFWVARMIMAGLEFMGDIPFEDVYIHGTVRDQTGAKMSKSLGNIIDPLEVIDQYGADALRFSLMSITSVGQDVFLSRDKFELGRNFSNKIWNASRFISMNLKPKNIDVDLCVFFKKEKLELAERWILSKFYSMLKDLNKSFDNYRFNEAANLLYEFFWHNFCDWYLELAKLNIEESRVQVVLYKILEKFLRLLHPFMPFITEEIWQALPHRGDSIMAQNWPHVQEQIIDKKAESAMQPIFDSISCIRNLKADFGLQNAKGLKVSISCPKKSLRDTLDNFSTSVIKLASISTLEIKEELKRPKHSASAALKDVEVFIPLEGVVDFASQKKKIESDLLELSQELKNREKKLKNKNFVSKAPKEVVEREKVRCQEIKELASKLKELKNAFE